MRSGQRRWAALLVAFAAACSASGETPSTTATTARPALNSFDPTYRPTVDFSTCAAPDLADSNAAGGLDLGIDFVDVTERAGLELEPLPICSPPDCGLTDAAQGAAVALGREPATSAELSVLCQVERFTGGVAVGDFDADGLPDLVVPRIDGPTRLLRNTGGQFIDVTTESGLDAVWQPAAGVAVADIDNDGDADIAVATIASPRHLLWLNDGGAKFREAAVERGVAALDTGPHVSFSVAAGDYDSDGYADLFFTEYRASLEASGPSSGDVHLLRNRGAERPGYFEDVTVDAGVATPSDQVFAFGASFADLDVDGAVDLAVTADFGMSRVLWNDGSGRFVDGTVSAGMGTDENGMGSATGDIDRDGLPDRIVTSVYDARGSAIARGGTWGASGNRVFVHRGGRSFADITDLAGVRDTGWGWGVALLDISNRGVLDLVIASGLDYQQHELATPFAAGRTALFVGDGRGRFAAVPGNGGIGTRHGRGVATVDFDQDGRLDVLVVQPGGRPRLLRNRSVAGNALRVRVVGSTSGSDAFGAVVTAEIGSRPDLVRVVGHGSDYLAQSEALLWFGLDDLESVDQLTVRFPSSGRTVTLHNVIADAIVTVEEPS